jgi:hypothetical protein
VLSEPDRDMEKLGGDHMAGADGGAGILRPSMRPDGHETVALVMPGNASKPTWSSDGQTPLNRAWTPPSAQAILFAPLQLGVVHR